MRLYPWNEIVKDIKAEGLTIKEVAAHAHMSISGFRYRYSKGMLEVDDIDFLNDSIKEARETKELNRK